MKQKKITRNMISQMAKQSLKSNRLRNLFTCATIILASALLTAILLFAMGQRQQTKDALSHRQQVSYYELTAGQAETLKKDSRISCCVQVKTGILSQMEGFDAMPYYVSQLTDDIRIGELERGSLPDAENEIAVQAAMLEKMGISPAPGANVTLTFYDGNTETFTVSGILKGGETAKQFSVFFSLAYAENGSQLKDMPYKIYARLHDAVYLSAVECREEMYNIGRDAGIQRKYVAPSNAFLDSLSPDTQSILLYGLVGAVILLACILVIYGVFYLSVIGRIHQFGQLRTLGMGRRQIGKLVTREGSLLFLRSAPLGIVIGGIAGYLIIPDGFHPLNALKAILLVFAVIYVITLASVRKPASLAAKVSPMEALRYVPQDQMAKAENRKICRSLTPLGLGRMNFSKNKKKAAITMLSLGLGGILFMTAATYMSSFQKTNFARQGYFTDAEFHIYYPESAISLNENGMSGLQAQSPMEQALVAQLSALEGVKKVTEIKNFGVRFDYPQKEEYNTNDAVYPLTEKETKEIDKYLEEGSADYDKLMSGDYLLAAGNAIAEEIYGWKFTVGDTILLHYFDGDQAAERQVTILGILNEQYVLDHKGLDGWFLMPELAILNQVNLENLNAHLLVTTFPEKEEAVGELLEEIVAGRPELAMETLAERRIAYGRNADQLFGAISGLAIFIMTFSILSMMNTLITNIVTRKQELAMLESIGMSKAQIRKMLLGESLLFVLVTLGVTMTAGTLCGYLLSSLLYKKGAFYMAFRFPAALSLAYGAVLVLVPLLITLLSLRSFSREALVERLRGLEN